MSDFRDAIGWAALGDPIGDDDGSDAAQAMGDDVLAMPEMQAVKAVLNVLLVRKAGSFEDAWDPDVWDALVDLPPAVVDWACP